MIELRINLIGFSFNNLAFRLVFNQVFKLPDPDFELLIFLYEGLKTGRIWFWGRIFLLLLSPHVLDCVKVLLDLLLVFFWFTFFRTCAVEICFKLLFLKNDWLFLRGEAAHWKIQSYVLKVLFWCWLFFLLCFGDTFCSLLNSSMAFVCTLNQFLVQ